MPLNYVRKFGDDLTFARNNGIIATDFDSLTGQWATQGINVYMLGRMSSHPEMTVEQVLDESFAQAATFNDGNWMIFRL